MLGAHGFLRKSKVNFVVAKILAFLNQPKFNHYSAVGDYKERQNRRSINSERLNGWRLTSLIATSSFVRMFVPIGTHKRLKRVGQAIIQSRNGALNAAQSDRRISYKLKDATK